MGTVEGDDADIMPEKMQIYGNLMPCPTVEGWVYHLYASKESYPVKGDRAYKFSVFRFMYSPAFFKWYGLGTDILNASFCFLYGKSIPGLRDSADRIPNLSHCCFQLKNDTSSLPVKLQPTVLLGYDFWSWQSRLEIKKNMQHILRNQGIPGFIIRN